uniref:GPI-anchored protein LLG1-like domain-containing protein n=1 Tax=Leersia perrieri TaxID=77586 RepID=A0A0D9W6S6_9ORYZ
MGTAIILLCCVSLFVVVSSAAEAEVPQDGANFLSEAVLASSTATHEMSEKARKLFVPSKDNVTGSPCPVRFEKVKGFEELGDTCKKRPKNCCAAFKKLACPHSKVLNNPNNGCAEDLFYFIFHRGKLNPETFTFADKCKEGPDGLAC